MLLLVGCGSVRDVNRYEDNDCYDYDNYDDRELLNMDLEYNTNR